MMKSLRKWLEKSGYNPEKVKLFGGGEALEVSTPYQGQTPTAEQFATLAEIRRHVSRHYAGIKVEPRGFYSSIYIYCHNQSDAFRLFVVRSVCFWWARALLPFCFSQISGGVFVIPKNKRLFFPAGCVPVWFGCKNAQYLDNALYQPYTDFIYLWQGYRLTR